MKCLSVREPWASLIVDGIKDVENRTIWTAYRGPVLIHASRTFDKANGRAALDQAIKSLPQDWPGPVVYYATLNKKQPELSPIFLRTMGAIIGQAEIVGCMQGSKSQWAQPDAWHWVLKNPKRFMPPVLFPGRLGLFDAPNPDDGHLFKPHDGQTRRVCVTQEQPDVMITRPGKWGNPWAVKPAGKGCDVIAPGGQLLARFTHYSTAASLAVQEFRSYLENNAGLMAALPELAGKRLGCFCPLGSPCHGDVLVEKVKEVCGE